MNLALFLLALLFVSVAVSPLAERLRLPTSSVLVALGFGASELAVAIGIDTGVRWHSFHDLVIYLLLPALIFEAALHLKVRDLVSDLAPILSLAIPFLLVSTAACAFVLYYTIGHPIGFPWAAALFTGAILSATDPVAVVALFKKLGTPPRLTRLVDGESLFNDATAIVVAMIVLDLVITGATFSVQGTVLEFARVFVGGIALGAATGLVAVVVLPLASSRYQCMTLSVAAAYGSYLAGELVLDVSGVMATLVTALVITIRMRRRRAQDFTMVAESWAGNAELANTAMFLIMGVTITTDMFAERWLAMLIGIAAALLARALVIYLALPAAGKLPGFPSVPSAYRHVLYWGGLRGAVTVALALSLPLEVDWWFTAQSVAYGVVLFSLFIQAPTLAPLVRNIGSREPARQE